MQLKCNCPPAMQVTTVLKLLCVVFLLTAFYPAVMAQEKRYSIQFSGEKASSAFRKVENMSGYKIQFNYKDVDYSVTFSAKEKTALEIVRMIIQGRNLDVTQKGKYLSITRKRPEVREVRSSRMLTGQVVDENGEPLLGATIAVKYSNRGDLFTITDTEGNFQLERYGNELSIAASYVGYEKSTIKVRADRSEYKFQLHAGVQDMDEVVVTGIFNKPKVSFTGAATVITKEEIAATGNRNLLSTIAILDPSFDLQEANTSGSNPNQTLNIEIRGTSTLGDVRNLQNNIRNQYNLPLFILDGFEVSSERVMDMNQSDVESVVLLKDASATAIYGSRGANGVMVITSKRPEFGKLRVSYSLGANLEIPDLSSYNLLNSFEKIEAERLAGYYTSTTLSTQLQLDEIYNENLRAANEGVNTDWLGKPLRVGVGQYHNLNLSGGNDQFRYILAFSYNQLNGVMKGSSRNNLNGSMTISYMLKKVRLSNNLSIGINDAENSPYGVFSKYAVMNPYWRPFDEKGEPITSYYALGSSYPTANPLYNAAQTSFSNSDYLNVRESLSLDIDLMRSLRLNLNAGYTQQRDESNSFTSPKASTYTIEGSYSVNERGNYNRTNKRSESWQVGATLNWAQVWGEHSVYVGLNAQMMESHNDQTSISVRGFMNDQMNDISNANSYSGTKPTSNESTTRSIGFTGTANYSYAQRYFADFSYRMDGASSFGKDSRWAPFWSLGLGWDFSREKWVQKAMPFITSGKLRYSYGVTGTLGFSPYESLTTYQYNTESQYNYMTGASIIAYGNPNLQWQDTKQHNIGLDLGLFNGRFTLTFNYYRKTTTNMLADAYLPLSHGFTTYKENIGVMRNTGYDWLMSYSFLRKPEKQIDWSIRAGGYHNENVIVKLSEAMKRMNEQYNNGVTSFDTNYQYREGRSVDELYVLKSAGIDPESGKRLYVADDGTITTNSSGIKTISVGNRQPKINGRLGTSFRWKGLLVDVNFSIRWGGKKLNTTLLSRVENANIKGGNVDRRVLSLRWQKPGDVTAYKALGDEDNTLANDLFVFTEKTMTLSSANITYELPQSWIRRFNMARLAITASMQDVLYMSNIEQERGTDYPYSYKPTFQISCTF